jgi:hypothetical protein
MAAQYSLASEGASHAVRSTRAVRPPSSNERSRPPPQPAAALTATDGGS